MNNENNNPVKLGITSHLAVDHGAAQNTPRNVMPNNNRPARIPKYYLNLTRRIDELERRINNIGVKK